MAELQVPDAEHTYVSIILKPDQTGMRRLYSKPVRMAMLSEWPL